MNNQTLAEVALEKIKQDILSYEFKPGSRLNIEDLKRRYNIGLTPLREALNRLVSIGFAEFIGMKGFRVTQLCKNDLLDIYSTRQLIETKALQLALKYSDDEFEAQLLASYHRLAKIEQNKEFNIVQWMQRYHDFHFALLNGCRSHWLLTLDKLLFEQSERYRYLRMIKAENISKLIEKKAKAHKKIVSYILAQEKQPAINLFIAQLQETVNDLLKMWEQSS